MISAARTVLVIILSSIANLFNLGALVFLWLAWKSAPAYLNLPNPLEGGK